MRALLGAACLAIAAVAIPVRAQPTESDRADVERLFQEGVRAAREERWVAARRAFEQAYARMPRPAILLNLGIAQQQTEQLRAARESFRRFLSDPSAPEALRDQAEQALLELEPEIPHLRVEAPGMLAGDRALVDGEPVERSELADLRVDPGRHRVTIERGGDEIARVEVDASRDNDAVARLDVPAGAGAAAAHDVSIAAASDPTWHVVGALALGVAGLGLIAVDGATLALEGSCARQGPSGCEQTWALEPISFGVYGAIGIASAIGSIVWLVGALWSSGRPSAVAWNGRGLSFAWEL